MVAQVDLVLSSFVGVVAGNMYDLLEINGCAHFSIENIAILSPNHRLKGHPPAP
jgi:hypothetical protein